ncbi:aminoglycoside adenylyltransferase family protein [Pseudorhodoferax sp.]|uniref:aminoglycoside adenylyltransferase family protein n=1 Tax=Pseudorhodoferax sp. TaxID=1993553 RepID=UPI002DD6B65E|nr:aminoglycoside adenylyltransferase family protein [Pseudorhodoferax sp.]
MPVPPQIDRQVADAQAVLQRHLAGSLQALHLFGSAVDGGLQPCSDIDLLATVATPPAEPARRALLQELLSVSAPPGSTGPWRALEVTVLAHGAVRPWRHPAQRVLQFGEWLRADLRAGVFEPPMPDHDLAILLTKARQHSVALLGPPAADWFAPVPVADFARALADTLALWNGPADWHGDERHVVLALARIWYSAATGAIASKQAAADWLLPRLAPENRGVLQAARAAYLGQANDDLAAQAASLAAFVHHAKAAIAALPDLTTAPCTPPS